MAGRDIVCLHGLGRSASDWDSVLDGLTACGEVTALDGSPAEQADSISASRMCAGTVLVGHSLGAMLALKVASGSSSVSGLILTSGFYPPGRHDQSYPAALGGYARHRVAVANALVSKGARPRRGGAQALTRLVGMGLRPARFHRLATGVRVPVLVIHGDEDHHVPIEFMLAAARRYPHWDVRVLAGGGHHVHVDQPEDWLAITTAWLRELG